MSTSVRVITYTITLEKITRVHGEHRRMQFAVASMELTVWRRGAVDPSGAPFVPESMIGILESLILMH